MFRLTPVVKFMLIVLVGVFLLSYALRSSGIYLPDYIALYNYPTENFQPYQIVTYMLSHADFRHLFGNAIILVIFGPMVEDYLGSIRFGNFVMICGVGVGASWLVWQNIDLIGASWAADDYYKNPSLNAFYRYLSEYRPHVFSNLELIPEVNEFVMAFEKNPTDMEYLNQSKELVQQAYLGLKESSRTSVHGFSGVCFGFLALAGLYMPDKELRFFLIPISFKLKYLVIVYIGYELYKIVTPSTDPNYNISNISHIFGVLFAVIMYKVWEFIDSRKA